MTALAIVAGATLADVALKRKELAELSAINFVKMDALSEESKVQIIEALAGADYNTYAAVCSIWKGTYMTERSVTTGAADTAWHRMAKNFGVEAPKSESPEAVAKRGAREAEKKALALVSAKELAETRDKALAAAKEAIDKADMEACTKAQSEARKAINELVRRQKDEGKEAHDKLTERRNKVIARIREANHEMLARIEQLLDGAAGNQEPASKPAKTKKAA